MKPPLPPNADDEPLAAAASRGDRAAFEQLVARYTPRLLRYLIARGLSPEAAEDVAQETWLKVWKSLPVRQSGPFVAWLLRIARNAGEDYRKSPRNRRTTAPVEVLSLLSSAGPGPDQLAAGSDTARKLRECLARLSAECRAVIEGYTGCESYDDLARRLGIPVGTVKSRLSRVRRELRECLGADAS